MAKKKKVKKFIIKVGSIIEDTRIVNSPSYKVDIIGDIIDEYGSSIRKNYVCHNVNNENEKHTIDSLYAQTVYVSSRYESF